MELENLVNSLEVTKLNDESMLVKFADSIIICKDDKYYNFTSNKVYNLDEDGILKVGEDSKIFKEDDYILIVNGEYVTHGSKEEVIDKSLSYDFSVDCNKVTKDNFAMYYYIDDNRLIFLDGDYDAFKDDVDFDFLIVNTKNIDIALANFSWLEEPLVEFMKEWVKENG